jgi:hypothetical protein
MIACQVRKDNWRGVALGVPEWPGEHAASERNNTQHLPLLAASGNSSCSAPLRPLPPD